MTKNFKQSVKAVVFLTILPMILFDILFYITYYIVNNLADSVTAMMIKNAVSLPPIYILNDLPHRLIIPTTLILIISTFILCHLTKIKFYSQNVPAQLCGNIRALVIFKLVAVPCAFYFYWYFAVEPLFYNVNFAENPLLKLVNIYKIFIPIIFALFLLLICVDSFLSLKNNHTDK